MCFHFEIFLFISSLCICSVVDFIAWLAWHRPINNDSQSYRIVGTRYHYMGTVVGQIERI